MKNGLQQGQIIKLPNSGVAEVLFVNESRARIKLLNRTKKTIHTAMGEEISFFSSGRVYDISPNSEVKVVKRKNSLTLNPSPKERDFKSV